MDIASLPPERYCEFSLSTDATWSVGRGERGREAHAVGHKKKLGYARAKEGIYVSDIVHVARRGVLQSRSLGIYTPRER